MFDFGTVPRKHGNLCQPVEGRQMIAAVVFVIALSRSAGLADRKMEEIYRLSAAREAGGVDGN